jgi:hypothetical protein
MIALIVGLSKHSEKRKKSSRLLIGESGWKNEVKNRMVLTKMHITFVVDKEESCKYTVEGTSSTPPYDNIEIMLRRREQKKKMTRNSERTLYLVHPREGG